MDVVDVVPGATDEAVVLDPANAVPDAPDLFGFGCHLVS
jgi:hypothetical protein